VRDFIFGEILSLAGGAGGFERIATGDDGAVAIIGEGGAEDGGEDMAEEVEALVLVFIFLARLVLAFSSSSEEGYEPESCLTCLRSDFRSCFASCAKAP